MDMEDTDRPALYSDLKLLYSDLKALEGKVEVKLERLALDLRTTEARLAKAIVKTDARLERMEETLSSLMTKADGERIFERLDYLMGKDRDNDRTVLVFDHILKDHELRIKRLEGRA